MDILLKKKFRGKEILDDIVLILDEKFRKIREIISEVIVDTLSESKMTFYKITRLHHI